MEEILDSEKKKPTKKIYDNMLVGSLMVPIAIVLVGELIIFGVTKILSTDRTHRDLVLELQSKTFGNRWIAAYELSKLISSERIPEKDKKFVATSLSEIFNQSLDPRTRKFIITALGPLKEVSSLKVLEKALDDKDKEVRFFSLVSLSKMPAGIEFNWSKLANIIKSDSDLGLKQAAILTLATHKIDKYKDLLILKTKSEYKKIRYASAMGLINFKDIKAIPVLKEILTEKVKLSYNNQNEKKNIDELVSLKINVIHLLIKNKWMVLKETILNLSSLEEVNIKYPKLLGQTREFLKILK